MGKIKYVPANYGYVEHAEDIQRLILAEAKQNKMLAWPVEDLRDKIVRQEAYLALSAGKVIGFICLVKWQKCVEICAWIVHPRFRQESVGSNLLRLIINLAKRRYPDKAIIILPNEVSAKICRRFNFRSRSKDRIDPEIWQACVNCGEYAKFPCCHCQPLCWQKEEGDADCQS